jgi:hypothetical protein
VLTVFMVALSALCALSLHHLCHDALFPPETGMPRARTCDRLDPWHPSVALMLVAIPATALVTSALRRRPRLALAATVGIAVLVVIAVVLVGSQDARAPSP